jgi:RHH-type rel operon transcriptional repressor/antitoxin RelB
MFSIRLPKETEDRLSALSARTHRSKSSYVKEALEQYLEDEEDYSLLVSAYEKHLRTEGKTHSLESVKKELGIEQDA